jgi:hypothetical protein
MKVVHQMRATACEVTVAGGEVAVYAHGGTVGTAVFIMPWRVFAQATRGPADANGRPFPLEEPPSGRGRRGTLPPARLAAYVAARKLHEESGISRAQAATRCGVKKHSFLGWLRKQRASERTQKQEHHA